MKVNLKVEKTILDQLKIRAIHQGINLQQLTEQYLTRMLRTEP